MNKLSNSISILASFATLKILNDTKRYVNSYQILSEFICYIIGTQNIISFTSVEMKNMLKEIFGFNIPEAVVKTASRGLPFITKSEGLFTVNKDLFLYDPSFEETKESAENTNFCIIDSLSEYIKEREPTKVIEKEILTQELIALLVDDPKKATNQYTDLISEFILKNENNQELQKKLRDIQEGSIIYIGLNHNINETGSITKKLTLFLCTEVLFSLVGYNGEIHKQFAEDFFSQVKSANTGGKKIHLRYFSETKEEIDTFFSTAELIVERKMPSFDTVAMRTIIKDCANSADVAIKKSDFYHKLQVNYNIFEDNNNDYYSADNDPYNLESMLFTDPQLQTSWKFISHINKLRKGTVFCNNTDSEYLLITNTKATIKASKEQTEKIKAENKIESASDYAVSINRITNILWYKLGYGFGRKEYPRNVDAVLKARVVLASSISHNVSELYKKIKEEHMNGEITDEQLAARIITLSSKPTLPEELEGDSIDESMDFSIEYLSRFEEEVKSNKSALKEKELELKRIKEQNEQQLVEKNNTIAKNELLIEKQNNEKNALKSELAKYKNKEEKRKRILCFALSVLWKVAIIAIITGIAFLIEKKVDSNIPIYVISAVDFVALALTFWKTFKKDIHKYFPKDKE